MNKKLIIIYFLLLIILISISRTLTSNKQKQTLEDQLIKNKFYNQTYKQRYINYYKSNKNLTLEQIIINVNIGLDNKFYDNIKESNYLKENLIIVNKYNYLNENYIPNNLEELNTKYSKENMKLIKEAKISFETLAEDALKENLNIIAMSTYRSYKYQLSLYNSYVLKDGQELADTYSARPGHSEHQTALAVDVCTKNTSYQEFENTKEFSWMIENAHKYGFILRYPKHKENITGYSYEPWHYRYIGVKEATYIYNNNITYEEYYTKFVENKK